MPALSSTRVGMAVGQLSGGLADHGEQYGQCAEPVHSHGCGDAGLRRQWQSHQRRHLSFGYDAENRRTSASGGGNTASYTCDPQGRRKTK
jgi:YD repeat-containing protein